jgi:hypothetical protein
MFDGMKATEGRFDAKLTYEARCVARALHRMKGISFGALARAFGTDDSAIQKMCNRSMTPYRSVKAENRKLGDEAFYAKYVKPEYEAHIAELEAVTTAERREKVDRKKAVKEDRRLKRKERSDAENAKIEAAVTRALRSDSKNA